MKKNKATLTVVSALLLCAMALGLAGCAGEAEPKDLDAIAGSTNQTAAPSDEGTTATEKKPETGDDSPAETEKEAVPETRDVLEADEEPAESDSRVSASNLMKNVKAESTYAKPADERFISSQMRLSVDLFKGSVGKSKNKNVLISPLSIELALAMTANGADGQTRAEMETLLGGDTTIEELNEYLRTYVKSLPSDEKYKLGIANSIWFRDDESLTVKKDFLQTNADYYGAQVYKAPFDDSTVNDINSWVDEHTDGLIGGILKEIDESKMLYLINAMVFDAEWQDIYRETAVKDGTFTSIAGDERDVQMMASGESKYLDDGRATGFIKNYSGGRYSFAALLPNEDIDIYEYIDGLTDEGLLDTLENAERCTVNAEMPKFSSEYSLNMTVVLSELGMPTAFEKLADFSKMGNYMGFNLFISDVVHTTCIKVNERGTEAGAVTSVEMSAAASAAPTKVRDVTLDRPFVYMIIDNSTNLPIFIGVVVDITE